MTVAAELNLDPPDVFNRIMHISEPAHSDELKRFANTVHQDGYGDHEATAYEIANDWVTKGSNADGPVYFVT